MRLFFARPFLHHKLNIQKEGFIYGSYPGSKKFRFFRCSYHEYEGPRFQTGIPEILRGKSVREL